MKIIRRMITIRCFMLHTNLNFIFPFNKENSKPHLIYRSKKTPLTFQIITGKQNKNETKLMRNFRCRDDKYAYIYTQTPKRAHTHIHTDTHPHTLMAVSTAWPTTPGSDCHVPSPTEGIFAPVFKSKYRISCTIFQLSRERKRIVGLQNGVSNAKSGRLSSL